MEVLQFFSWIFKILRKQQKTDRDKQSICINYSLLLGLLNLLYTEPEHENIPLLYHSPHKSKVLGIRYKQPIVSSPGFLLCMFFKTTFEFLSWANLCSPFLDSRGKFHLLNDLKRQMRVHFLWYFLCPMNSARLKRLRRAIGWNCSKPTVYMVYCATFFYSNCFSLPYSGRRLLYIK